MLDAPLSSTSIRSTAFLHVHVPSLVSTWITMIHLGQTHGDSAASSSTSGYVPRASRACQMCRLKKTKCDQQNPCSYCQKHAVDCFYSSHRDGNTNEDKLRRARARKQGRSSSHRHANAEPPVHHSDHWDGSHVTVASSSPHSSEQLRTQLLSGVNSQQQVNDRKSPIHMSCLAF